MEWITGHHWTVGWGAILTALVGIVGVVGAVTSTVVTQRHQARNTTKQIAAADVRWSREADERHTDKAREAVACVLSLRPTIWEAAADSLATIMVLHGLTVTGSEQKVVLATEQTDNLEVLLNATNEVEHAVAQVRLLTQDTRAVACLDELASSLSAVVAAARKVPKGDFAVVGNHSKANRRLTHAFKDLRDTATELYARPE